jgi:hypothetical protein
VVETPACPEDAAAKMRAYKREWARINRQKHPEKQREASRRFYSRNKDRFARRWKKYYECNKLKLKLARKKPSDEQRQKKTEYDRRRREMLRDKIREQKHEHYTKNKAAILKRNRSYYQNNKDAVRVRGMEYYIANREHIVLRNKEYATKNKDKLRAAARRYKKANPHIVAAENHRRRACKLNAPCGDKSQIKAFCKHVRTANRMRCYWCNKVAPKGKRHIDHIIAISCGGSDSVGNLCCSCSGCNTKKSNKPPEVFSGQYVMVFNDAREVAE